jgi:hypothetical protein
MWKRLASVPPLVEDIGQGSGVDRREALSEHLERLHRLIVSGSCRPGTPAPSSSLYATRLDDGAATS